MRKALSMTNDKVAHSSTISHLKNPGPCRRLCLGRQSATPAVPAGCSAAIENFCRTAPSRKSRTPEQLNAAALRSRLPGHSSRHRRKHDAALRSGAWRPRAGACAAVLECRQSSLPGHGEFLRHQRRRGAGSDCASIGQQRRLGRRLPLRMRFRFGRHAVPRRDVCQHGDRPSGLAGSAVRGGIERVLHGSPRQGLGVRIQQRRRPIALLSRRRNAVGHSGRISNCGRLGRGRLSRLGDAHRVDRSERRVDGLRHPLHLLDAFARLLHRTDRAGGRRDTAGQLSGSYRPKLGVCRLGGGRQGKSP